MLDEVLLHINFKCITDDNLGKVIKKVYTNQREYHLENKYNLVNKRYYVSSVYRPRVVNNNLKYYGITNYVTDIEISDYKLFQKIKIGKIYKLRYYKHDKSRIILQVEEFKYQDELNKYFINDISNIVVGYLKYYWYSREWKIIYLSQTKTYSMY